MVCDADVSRGPCAAALLRHRLDADRWQVVSAGTDAVEGAQVSADMRQAACEQGIELDRHRAIRVSAELVRSADLVIAMSHRERARLLELEPSMQRRVRLLGGFEPRRADHGSVEETPAVGHEIPDPVGGGIDLHRDCCRRLELGVTQLARWLARREAARPSPTPRQPPSAPELRALRLR